MDNPKSPPPLQQIMADHKLCFSKTLKKSTVSHIIEVPKPVLDAIMSHIKQEIKKYEHKKEFFCDNRRERATIETLRGIKEKLSALYRE